MPRSAPRRSVPARVIAPAETGTLRLDQVVPLGPRLATLGRAYDNDQLAHCALTVGGPDEQALFYERWWGVFVRYFASRVSDEAEAQDFASELLLDLLASRSAFDPSKGTARGWLWGAARRRAATANRTRANQARLESEVLGVGQPGTATKSASRATCPVATLAAGQLLGEPAPTPLEQVERADQRRRTREVLCSLPSRRDRLALLRAAARDRSTTASPPLTGAERVAAHAARRRAAAHVREVAPHLVPASCRAA